LNGAGIHLLRGSVATIGGVVVDVKEKIVVEGEIGSEGIDYDRASSLYNQMIDQLKTL